MGDLAPPQSLGAEETEIYQAVSEKPRSASPKEQRASTGRLGLELTSSVPRRLRKDDLKPVCLLEKGTLSREDHMWVFYIQCLAYDTNVRRSKKL